VECYENYIGRIQKQSATQEQDDLVEQRAAARLLLVFKISAVLPFLSRFATYFDFKSWKMNLQRAAVWAWARSIMFLAESRKSCRMANKYPAAS